MIADGPNSSPRDRRVGTAALIGTIVLSIVPALLVRIPPLGDYPNHYVRLWLIAGGVSVAPVSSMYALDWSGASTNIAIDLVALALRGIVPVGVIGPLVVMLAIVLPPLGLFLLGQKLFGTARWWHVLCFVLAWNWALVAGFLNFDISLGLALLGAAFDARWARHGLAVLVPLRIVFGAIVLFAHPFGFLFYAALLGGLAIGASVTPLRTLRGLGQALVRVVSACLPTIVPLAALLLLAPVLPGNHRGAAVIAWQEQTLSAHVSLMLTEIKTYRFSVDLLFGSCLALPVLAALVGGRLRVHAGLLIAALVLAFCSLFVPRMTLGASSVETRLPCMVALAACVAVLPDFRLSRRVAAFATVAAMLVVAARSAWVGHVWLERQSDFASLGRALRHVPAGAAVLPLEHLPDAAGMAGAPIGRFLARRNPLFWHEPVLAIMDRHAFVPTLFTAAGQQPIRVLAPWNAIAIPAGPLMTVDKIDAPVVPDAPYLSDWRACFDYILVVNADMPNAGGPLPKLPSILPVADEGFAQLYRIRHPDGARACH